MGGIGSGKMPIDLVGRKFGRLTVKRLVSRRPVTWECECDCGTILFVSPSGHLIGKNTKSCGCIKQERMAKLSKKRPYESIYNNFVKVNSRSRFCPVIEITYDDFVGFTTTTECHYCGGLISWTAYNANKNGWAYNLDRKDNTLGYTKDNVVVCCSRCNFGKGDQFTYEEWVEVGKCLRHLRETKGNLNATYG